MCRLSAPPPNILLAYDYLSLRRNNFSTTQKLGRLNSPRYGPPVMWLVAFTDLYLTVPMISPSGHISLLRHDTTRRLIYYV